MTTGPGFELHDIRFRRPTEDDYPTLAASIEAWWDDRRPGELLERLWLRHFAGSCWLAEIGPGGGDADDPADAGAGDTADVYAQTDRATVTLIGYLAGFRSPGHPEVGVIKSIGVRPSHRRRGVGRALVERFLDDLRGAGATAVEALAWPGNRRAVAFLAGIGFEAETGPETRALYGTSSFEGYDFGTEDRARFLRPL